SRLQVQHIRVLIEVFQRFWHLNAAYPHGTAAQKHFVGIKHYGFNRSNSHSDRSNFWCFKAAPTFPLGDHSKLERKAFIYRYTPFFVGPVLQLLGSEAPAEYVIVFIIKYSCTGTKIVAYHI